MTTYAELEGRGVKIARQTYTRTPTEIKVEIAGVAFDKGLDGEVHAPVVQHGIILDITLPSPSVLTVEFRHEGLGTAMKKWFKAEVQTGEEDFDTRVYVDSSNEIPLLAKLLESKVLRDAILMAIVTGGGVDVEGAQIRWDNPTEEPSEEAVATLVSFALDHPPG